jgi:hypothetical protein
MDPPERIGQFKTIETTVTPVPPDPFAPNGYFGLQQVRWLPTNIADTPAEGLSRLFMLPGAHYSAPEFSWKYRSRLRESASSTARHWARTTETTCSSVRRGTSWKAARCSDSS